MTRKLESKEFVEIACEVRATTDRAVLLFDGMREAWVPRSQLETPDDELVKGTTLDVLMSEWIAKEKGFI
jgi:hypothetical protein